MTLLRFHELPALDKTPRDYPDLERLGMFRIYNQQFLHNCPKCHALLYNEPGGGLECRTKECGYRFCY